LTNYFEIADYLKEIIRKEKSGKRLRNVEKGLLKQFEDTKIGFKVGEKIVVLKDKHAVVGSVTKVETIRINGRKLTFIDTDKGQSGFSYHFNKFNPEKYAVQTVFGRNY